MAMAAEVQKHEVQITLPKIRVKRVAEWVTGRASLPVKSMGRLRVGFFAGAEPGFEGDAKAPAEPWPPDPAVNTVRSVPRFVLLAVAPLPLPRDEIWNALERRRRPATPPREKRPSLKHLRDALFTGRRPHRPSSSPIAALVPQLHPCNSCTSLVAAPRGDGCSSVAIQHHPCRRLPCQVEAFFSMTVEVFSKVEAFHKPVEAFSHTA